MRPPELTHQLIYKNPHAYCAWPDIKILQDGDWALAFCEAMRRPGITHLDPTLLNMLLRSEDGGQSWDGPQVIAGYDFFGMGRSRHGAALQRRPAGQYGAQQLCLARRSRRRRGLCTF